MQRTFFTSDTHFNHGNIIKYCHRPFMTDDEEKLLSEGENFRVCRESVSRMDEELIDQINSTVDENDILWHLGDFCFANKKFYYDTCWNYRKRIRCKHIRLIWGNHDHDPVLASCGFEEAHRLLHTKINGQLISLCHHAMITWEHSGKQAWNLYGHSHRNLEPWADEHLPGRLSLDVGVDNAAELLGAYRPFSFEEIREIFEDRSGFSADHHHDRGHWRTYRKKVGPKGSLSDA